MFSSIHWLKISSTGSTFNKCSDTAGNPNIRKLSTKFKHFIFLQLEKRILKLSIYYASQENNSYKFISSYLVNKRMISTPAMLVSNALTDAHRPFLSVGRLITNIEIRFASKPNPQQHMIITPSTMNFRSLG